MNANQNTPPDQPHMLFVYAGRLDLDLFGTVTLKLTKALRQLGWKVTLVCYGKDGMDTINGVEVLRIKTIEKYFLGMMIFHLRLAFYILAHWSSFDIIFLQQVSIAYLFPLKYFRYLKKGRSPLFVADSRTVPMEDDRKASLKDRLRAWYYYRMFDLANHWADGQTTISHRMAELVKIPPKDLWGVWPSAADVEQFAPALAARHWPGPDEPVHIAYIGILHYERNLMALCRAIEMANAEGMNFILSLTGYGTEQADLAEFASHTAGRIQVNPPVPHSQVPGVLAGVHVGVLPFPDEEKFRVSSPIKLFEYMASGLPILATRIACHTDVIQNGTYVFWAEESDSAGLLDALRRVWQARASLKPMGEAAAQAAQAHTWLESARNLIDALNYGLELHARTSPHKSIPTPLSDK